MTPRRKIPDFGCRVLREKFPRARTGTPVRQFSPKTISHKRRRITSGCIGGRLSSIWDREFARVAVTLRRAVASRHKHLRTSLQGRVRRRYRLRRLAREHFQQRRP